MTITVLPVALSFLFATAVFACYTLSALIMWLMTKVPAYTVGILRVSKLPWEPLEGILAGQMVCP